MLKTIKSFVISEDGAITVDWVVLTALVVGLQVLILVTSIRESLVGVSENIGDKVSEYEDFLK
ncbi:Flp family type IVb pilin [Fuscovulum blasticum]|uniref:Flp family type IVb pilin n=1 Tax=Fuscovulum blasticum TaxID=1075 RepID=UPI000D3E8856|nr:hypothetical protein [Fuscovulum blasticum]AWD23331.1 hypothetical protein B6K69_05730 [Fuscovulum blasticum]